MCMLNINTKACKYLVEYHVKSIAKSDIASRL